MLRFFSSLLVSQPSGNPGVCSTVRSPPAHSVVRPRRGPGSWAGRDAVRHRVDQGPLSGFVITTLSTPDAAS